MTDIEAILKDTGKAFTFVRDCSDEEFELYKTRLVGAVLAGDVHWSHWTGFDKPMGWKRERFDRYADILVERITDDSLYSQEAVKGWPEELVEQHGRRLVSAVLRDYEQVINAVDQWPSERRKKYEQELIGKLEEYPEYILAAKIKLGEERFGEYESGFVEAINQYYGTDRFESKFFDKLGECYNLISELSEDEQVEAKKAFFEGLGKSLVNDKFEPWAEYVLKHFHKDAIGGGQYRQLGVVG